jgi:hypothetical protein
MMKRICLIVVSLGFCAGIAGAQSLVELAKKEKERRKQNAEQGEEAEEYTLAGDAGEDPDAPSDAPIEVGEDDDWDSIMARYQSRYDSHKSYLRSQEASLRQCEQQREEYEDRQRERDKANAIRSGTSWLETERRREREQYYEPYSCEYYTNSIEETKRRMEALSNEVANEARKRRILPGRARLRK